MANRIKISLKLYSDIIHSASKNVAYRCGHLGAPDVYLLGSSNYREPYVTNVGLKINTPRANIDGCWEMIDLGKSKLEEALFKFTKQRYISQGICRIGNFDTQKHVDLGESLRVLAKTAPSMWLLSIAQKSVVCDRYNIRTELGRPRYRKVTYYIEVI